MGLCIAQSLAPGHSHWRALVRRRVLALFGERVTTQFMSQATGWGDIILLAIGPLGIVTIVSAIRVGGPIWLRSVIGRARENSAAAKVDVFDVQ